MTRLGWLRKEAALIVRRVAGRPTGRDSLLLLATHGGEKAREAVERVILLRENHRRM